MKKLYLFVVVVLIILGTIFQGLTMFRSGQKYDFGIGYWGPTARDGVWHQALVESLKRHVPPKNPGLAGVKLTNYHYYYDLLVAKTGVITGISTTDLIYRIFPVIFSILFGIGTLLLSQELFKSKRTDIFCLFFSYFGSSFGWVVEFIRERHFGGESAFWMNQPVSMNLNPPFAISMIMVIWITILFMKFQKKVSWKIATPLIILSGLLIEFKVYAGIIVLGALLAVSIKSLFIKKNASYFWISIPAIILSALLFIPQVSINGSFFEFKPFWFIHSMIDSPDRVGWLRLASARVNYLLAGNYPKFVLAEILAFFIFAIGNLGTRVVGLVPAYRIWKKNILTSGKFCFIFWMSVLSFVIPLFFVQKGNPWNTIQFGYYFLYFSSLFAGFALAKISTMKPKIFALGLVFLILIITPISSYTTFTFAYTNAPPARLTNGEFQALEFLKSSEDGVVLTPLFDKSFRFSYVNPFPLVVYDTTAYVAAFSGKPVFLEDEGQQEILGSNYLGRKAEVQNFFSGSDFTSKENFLRENNIKYIYIPKIYKYSLVDLKRITNVIYENNEVFIYEFLK